MMFEKKMNDTTKEYKGMGVGGKREITKIPPYYGGVPSGEVVISAIHSNFKWKTLL